MDTQSIRKEVAGEIKRLQRVYEMLGGEEATDGRPRKRRQMSAEARAKISAAQTARWNKTKGTKKKKEVAAPAA